MKAFEIRMLWLGYAVVAVLAPVCAAQVASAGSVKQAPSADAKEMQFKDPQFQVSFTVPPGWGFARKDGQVSTFHVDARSAPRRSELRGVATLTFNPYPRSTLSGAEFFFSVERRAGEEECAQQAIAKEPSWVHPAGKHRDVQDIAGMAFTHGHDEYGDVCIEERDDVYTAYRKGSCYRFDLTLSTFCAESSGAQAMNVQQMQEVEKRLNAILSSVSFGWEKAGTHPVAVPEAERTARPPAKVAQPDAPAVSPPADKAGS